MPNTFWPVFQTDILTLLAGLTALFGLYLTVKMLGEAFGLMEFLTRKDK